MESPHAAAALALALALWGPAAARAADASPPAAEASESDRLYQKGLHQYARGDRASALATFQAGLRRDPANRSLRAAVRRIESELAPPPAALAPVPRAGARRGSASRLERLFLVSIPRWFHFERTIGDAVSGVGTLNALNARVGQLLGERRLAFVQNRPFRKDRQLRELLRRAPLAARNPDEV